MNSTSSSQQSSEFSLESAEDMITTIPLLIFTPFGTIWISTKLKQRPESGRPSCTSPPPGTLRSNSTSPRGCSILPSHRRVVFFKPVLRDAQSAWQRFILIPTRIKTRGSGVVTSVEFKTSSPWMSATELPNNTSRLKEGTMGFSLS